MEDMMHAAEARRRKDWDFSRRMLQVCDWQVEGNCPVQVTFLDTWTAVIFASVDK